MVGGGFCRPVVVMGGAAARLGPVIIIYYCVFCASL